MMNANILNDIPIETKKENEEIKETLNPLHSSLIDYYLNRYLETHDYTLNVRLSKLDDEITSLEEEYHILEERENNLGEIFEKNKSLEEQISKIDQQIESNEAVFLDKKKLFEAKADIVTTLENNLYETCNDYYQNLLIKLSRGNINEIIDQMNFIVDIINYTLYNNVAHYKKEASIALEQLDNLNLLELETKNQNITLEKEKAALKEQIQVISFEETSAKFDMIANEITQKKAAKEELISLFKTLKKQNTKFIVDEIKHFEILEYTNQNIGLQLDDIISGFKSSLIVIDTTSNIISNKKTKLKKLYKELELMQPIKDQYDEKTNAYNHLQSIAKVVTSDIEQITEFISDAKKLIDVNQEFKQVAKHYHELKQRKTTVEQDREKYRIKNLQLVEIRKTKLNDPYGRDDLERVDCELKNVQEEFDKHDSEYSFINQELCSIKNSDQDSKVVNIYEELLECEQALPSLNQNLKRLNVMINDHYYAISNMTQQIKKYEDLSIEISNLEDEINDN